MRILQLDFKKTSEEIDTTDYGNVDLTNQENLINIEKYVLPIIAENEGWGTKDLTIEGFKQNPSHYQKDLDATLFANVNIILDENDNPVGLLEYLKETIHVPLFQERMTNIKGLVENKEKWEGLIKQGIVNKEAVDKFFPQLKEYISTKNIYSEIGIVIRPDLQGKGSGFTKILYNQLSNGIAFGWTSNPLYIANCRKYFNKTVYFPLITERINDLEGLACLAVLYGDLLTYTEDRLEGLKFGTLRSPYFISNRDSYYLDLSESLAKAGKITVLDHERIKYCIDKKDAQGAVIAIS